MNVPKRTKLSRARGGDFFDFTPRPQPIPSHAASAVTTDQLRVLFEHLDRIDETLESKNASYRKAALDALQAVIDFLGSSPFNTRDRFSRSLRLLWAELRDAPPAVPSEILPRHDRGGADTDAAPTTRTRKRLRYHVMACAAHATDALAKTGSAVKKAREDVAEILDRYRFAFGKKTTTKAKREKAVDDWRKGNVAPSVTALYRDMNATSPIPKSLAAWGDGEDKRSAILKWLEGELVKDGYGPIE